MPGQYSKRLTSTVLQPSDTKMTMTCTIRQLDRDDANAWASLRREALEAHPLAFGASIPDDPGYLVEFFLTRCASNAESVVFGAFIDGSLVGIVGVLRNAGKKEYHKAYIWGMYVAAGSRRGGAGEVLLRTAIQRGRSWSGIEQVHLSVSDVAYEARRLYERNGFQQWGREPRALCWEGNCADEIHMGLDVRGSTC